MKNIEKIIIPTSGLGERFRPFTNIIEKSLLPILTKPLIHYLVEEAVDSGGEEIIIVINSEESLVVKYLKNNPQFKNVKFTFVVQQKAKGLVNALYLATQKLKNEPFGLILGDELISYKDKAPLQLLITKYNKSQKNIIAIQEVSKNDLKNYGIVKLAQKTYDQEFSKIESAIEKPSISKALSKYAIIGRYVFNSSVSRLIKNNSKKVNSLIDLLQNEIQNDNCYAYKIQNDRYDIGSVKGFVRANKDFYKKKK